MRARQFMVMVAAMALLAACDDQAPVAQSTANSASGAIRGTDLTVSAELTGYNHTTNTIASFYVDGQWGGNLSPGTGGGSFVCCVRLPVLWHEGIKVKVVWEDHELKTQSRQVMVPKYDSKTLTDFGVHFLRNGEIKVFATYGGLRRRDYPLQGEEAELKPGVPIRHVD